MFGVEGLTSSLSFSIFIAAFGSAFQHGYNTGVLNVPRTTIESWSKTVWKNTGQTAPPTLVYSTLISFYCLGGVAGGFAIHTWSRMFGRKWGILFNNSLVYISASLMVFSKSSGSLLMFLAGRFLIGMNNGLNSGIVPMYLTEIAPFEIRGGVGSFYQLISTSAMFVSNCVSNTNLLGSEEYWPYLFGLITVPAAIQTLLLPLCADSPRYLQERGRSDQARKALVWLRKTKDVEEELILIKKEMGYDASIGNATFMDIMTVPYLRIPLMISCVVMLAQQFSGISPFIFYSTSIFESASIDNKSAQLATLAVSVVSIGMTMVSLVFVDMTGRKFLLVTGFSLMIANTFFFFGSLFYAQSYALSVIGSNFTVLSAVLFTLLFAIGPASIPWFLVCELFMTNARQQAASIAVSVNWFSNYIIASVFPLLEKKMGAYVYLIFAVFQLFLVSFVMITMPRTNLRPVREIVKEIKKSDF